MQKVKKESANHRDPQGTDLIGEGPKIMSPQRRVKDQRILTWGWGRGANNTIIFVFKYLQGIRATPGADIISEVTVRTDEWDPQENKF